MKYSWYDVVEEHDTILEAGQMYKQLVRNKLKQHIKMKKGPVAFSILCQIKLVKYNNSLEELYQESADIYYLSTSKRVIFNTEKLLTSDGIKKVYHKAMVYLDEKLDQYLSEQPEWVMEKMPALILNIPKNENDFCNGNNLVCTCQECVQDREYEESETSDESGEDEWLEDNESIYRNDVAEENRDTQSNINK